MILTLLPGKSGPAGAAPKRVAVTDNPTQALRIPADRIGLDDILTRHERWLRRQGYDFRAIKDGDSYVLRRAWDGPAQYYAP